MATAIKPQLAPPAGAACLIGRTVGVKLADADTAALVFCRALREHGVQVGEPTHDASGAPSAYRVELRRLGTIHVLDVSFESPVGRPVDGRTVQLAGLEEMTVAAPRIARALVERTPVEDTARVDSIFGEEARRYPKKYGEFFFGIGVFAFMLPGTSIYAGAGPQLSVFFETPVYSVGGNLRFGYAEDGNSEAYMGGLSVGGRYFFTQNDIAPFVGGGFGYNSVDVENYGEDTDEDYDGRLFGAYAAVGVEFLRHYESRLDAELRIDFPFGELQDHSYDHNSHDDESKAMYVPPITINASYYF